MTSTNKLKDFFNDILFDILGCACYAIGINMFTAPNHIAPGGVLGISTMINHFLPFLQIGTINMCINIPLLLMAFKFLGKEFTFRTLKTVVISTILMDYVLAGVTPYTSNALLAAIFGGMLFGLGASLVFMRGSTTGGMDIVSKLLQLKFPHMQMGKLLVILDVIVITSSAFVFKNLEVSMYAIITTFAFSQALDTFLYGAKRGKMAMVVSDHSEEISKKIMDELHRGVTLLEGKGAYKGDKKSVAMCALSRNEFFKLQTLVKQTDPSAFIIVCEAHEIIGQGFKAIDKLD